MDFLKKNARSIIVALLAAGVIIVVSSTAEDQTDDKDVNTDTVQNEATSEPTSEDSVTTTETEAETDTDQEAVSENTQTNPESEGDQVQTSNDEYSTVAKLGENQTVLVRDVVAGYYEAEATMLSPEQKLYVETSLVDSLPRKDLINAGYMIKISKADIATKVSESMQLDQNALNRWSKYL